MRLSQIGIVDQILGNAKSNGCDLEHITLLQVAAVAVVKQSVQSSSRDLPEAVEYLHSAHLEITGEIEV